MKKKIHTKSVYSDGADFLNDSFIEMFFEIGYGEIEKLCLPCELKMLGSLEYMAN